MNLNPLSRCAATRGPGPLKFPVGICIRPAGHPGNHRDGHGRRWPNRIPPATTSGGQASA